MFIGTSIVPTPTSSGSKSHHYPGRSRILFNELDSSSDIDIKMSPTPTTTTTPCCSPTPNEVVINLSTAVLIPDYDLFYDTPIDSFHPTYTSLGDGSLIAQPFSQELVGSNRSLLIVGAMLMLFLHNIVVSGDYAVRGKVRKKGLFYLLLASQLLGLLGVMPFAISFFTQSVNCLFVVGIHQAATYVSLGLLITGILGVKAYRCLDNSRIVLIVLSILQSAALFVAVIDLKTAHGVRKLSGNCSRPRNKGYLPIFVVLQLLESLFICGSFSFAVWKSRHSPAARGRISIQLSMVDIAVTAPMEEITKEGHIENNAPAPRGWWDYVPKSTENLTAEPAALSPSADPDCIRNFQTRFQKIWGGNENEFSRPSSISRVVPTNTSHPAYQPPRQSTIRISENTDRSAQVRREHRVISPVPSSMSRLNRFMPRMVLFRAVMRDELCYTTFITLNFVVVAVLSLIGVTCKNDVSTPGWMALNWGVVSTLAMHSFGRVIRRHEQEALLRNPSTWDPNVRAEIMSAEVLRRGVGRPWSPVSLSNYPHRRVRRMASTTDSSSVAISDVRDPFENPSMHSRERTTSSWQSVGSISTVHSIPISPAPSVEYILRVPQMAAASYGPVILPSPVLEDFPPSTPVATGLDSERTSIVSHHRYIPENLGSQA